MGEGEEATGDGGQKVPGWTVVLGRDCEDGEGEDVTLLLAALPLLLLMPPPTLAPLFASPWGAPIVPSIPTGLTKPF